MFVTFLVKQFYFPANMNDSSIARPHVIHYFIGYWLGYGFMFRCNNRREVTKTK